METWIYTPRVPVKSTCAKITVNYCPPYCVSVGLIEATLCQSLTCLYATREVAVWILFCTSEGPCGPLYHYHSQMSNYQWLQMCSMHITQYSVYPLLSPCSSALVKLTNSLSVPLSPAHWLLSKCLYLGIAAKYTDSRTLKHSRHWH